MADADSDHRAAAPRAALYPNHYVWFVFLSVLDVLLTSVALQHSAHEANPLAAWLLHRYGVGGLVLLKFTAVPIVIGLCEFIGRRKSGTGRRLAEWIVALAAIPIVVTFVLLIARLYGGF